MRSHPVIATFAVLALVSMLQVDARAHDRPRGMHLVRRTPSMAADSTIPTDNGTLLLVAGTSQIALDWDAATDDRGVDHYVIRFATGAVAPANCVSGTEACANTSATSCTHLSLDENTQYSYRVCAVDAAGNPSTGLTATSFPSDVTNPTDGAALTLTAANQQISLSWNAASDNRSVDHYVIRFATGATAPANCSAGTQACTNTSGTSCAHTTLNNYTQYSYRVCAVDAANNTSTGITASGYPFANTVAVQFNNGVANEECNVTDNAVLETGNSYTVVIRLRRLANSAGDDIFFNKGIAGMSVLSQPAVEPNSNFRCSTGGVANHIHIPGVPWNQYNTFVCSWDGSQVDGPDAGSDANAERQWAWYGRLFLTTATTPAVSWGGTSPATWTNNTSPQSLGSGGGGFFADVNVDEVIYYRSGHPSQAWVDCVVNADMTLNDPRNCTGVSGAPTNWTLWLRADDDSAGTLTNRCIGANCAGNATCSNMDATNYVSN